LKAAKTSYFKTDFAWALKQFKELKSQIRSWSMIASYFFIDQWQYSRRFYTNSFERVCERGLSTLSK
jgi:hypothetical protein